MAKKDILMGSNVLKYASINIDESSRNISLLMPNLLSKILFSIAMILVFVSVAIPFGITSKLVLQNLDNKNVPIFFYSLLISIVLICVNVIISIKLANITVIKRIDVLLIIYLTAIVNIVVNLLYSFKVFGIESSIPFFILFAICILSSFYFVLQVLLRSNKKAYSIKFKLVVVSTILFILQLSTLSALFIGQRSVPIILVCLLPLIWVILFDLTTKYTIFKQLYANNISIPKTEWIYLVISSPLIGSYFFWDLTVSYTSDIILIAVNSLILIIVISLALLKYKFNKIRNIQMFHIQIIAVMISLGASLIGIYSLEYIEPYALYFLLPSLIILASGIITMVTNTSEMSNFSSYTISISSVLITLFALVTFILYFYRLEEKIITFLLPIDTLYISFIAFSYFLVEVFNVYNIFNSKKISVKNLKNKNIST